MAERRFQNVSYNFVLIHGAWFAPNCWQEVSKALKALGHHAIIPDLPSSDLQCTFADDALAVKKSIDSHDNLFFVPHSRGTETLPRLLGQIDLSRVIGAAILNSGGPHGFRLASEDGGEPLARYSPAFSQGLSTSDEGYTQLEPTTAKEVLFYGVEAHVAGQALGRFRQQRTAARSAGKLPPPPMPPRLPVYFVIGKDDKVLNLERARKVSQEWLGIEPTEKPWGHLPQLSHPVALAAQLVAWATAADNYAK